MPAKLGDTVSVRYTACLDDGTVVDEQYAEQPFEFKLGADIVIPGFERAVTGMRAGERKRIRIEPVDGYGEYRPDRVTVVERSELASLLEPRVGMMLRVGPNERSAENVTITRVTDEDVTLDGNHRLAGKALSFEIHLVAIDPA